MFLVCRSVVPQLHLTFGELNDLSAAATFRPDWVHAGKNKTCSHDLILKPVTAGSNHRFITTPKREASEGEEGDFNDRGRIDEKGDGGR